MSKTKTKKKSKKKTEMPKHEVVKAEQAVAPQQETSVQSFIQQAIQTGAPVETLKELFELQKQVKAEQAREAFIEAKAKFQADVPVIEKKKSVKNKKGQVVYKYAPLEDEIEQIKKPLADNHLAYSWNTENKDKMMKVTCYLTHIMGHTEESVFEIPIDDNQYMSSPQRYASAQTFAKRYTLNNVLGIATAEEDTDATDVDEKDGNPVSDKAKIVFNLKRLGYETDTKEKIHEAIKEATNLKAEEKNYSEIVSRLETAILEREEYDKTKS